ncbi:MAG: nodulation protein NfeD [Acidobacteria bacterium]|nr:nodulation protein NfeD [Acidobacteriota bacterium]MDW7983228.1 nodulation protein NfeD [Acidobacteriota bacterium]
MEHGIQRRKSGVRIGRWARTAGLGILVSLASAVAAAQTIYWLYVDTPIHPIALQYIEEGIRAAEANGAECLILQLNTPGGLVETTDRIIQRMLAARVPIIGFVAPSGAQAASAGFYILMATDLAAMAPGTRTGAATPVLSGGGGSQDNNEDVKTLRRKTQNDLIALMRSLAQRRGRNVDLAVQAITEARSFDEEEALRQKLIELIARDRSDLLKKLDGRSVVTWTGEQRRLKTGSATVAEYPMSFRHRILSFLMDPRVVYILLVLGMLGLYIEMTNPGLILPGVVGAVCLILALASTQVLPINWAGVLLIALAFLLFLLELKVVSYGLLTLGGILLLILGGLTLSRSPAEWAVSRTFLMAFAGAVGAAVALVIWYIIRAFRHPPATGQESLQGQTGWAETDLEPGNVGWVFADGTLWRATTSTSIPKGQPVRIVQVQGGMTLEVEALSPPDLKPPSDS